MGPEIEDDEAVCDPCGDPVEEDGDLCDACREERHREERAWARQALYYDDHALWHEEYDCEHLTCCPGED